ncbi:cell division protein FtsL [Ammoniphilus oxalaticus]|uniref:Cell division protein FtsL n=1 Tax=Ammoniphilus oxalaticus TaxID=66863 RepID=A0A419SJA1_9BACL|nr:cell division protein FtsL [Ammoniphilus oxalaticus]RKD24093.1 cell division protein FtsL [Ammoniphilus oxalaticus]
MNRHQYGNLAVQLNQQQVQPRVEQPNRKEPVSPYGIPIDEKLLYLLSVIVIVCISGFILSRYALISQMNYEVEGMKVAINETQEQNSSLKLKVDELSKRERILKIAQEELGMTSNNSTVRVLKP